MYLKVSQQHVLVYLKVSQQHVLVHLKSNDQKESYAHCSIGYYLSRGAYKDLTWSFVMVRHFTHAQRVGDTICLNTTTE